MNPFYISSIARVLLLPLLQTKGSELVFNKSLFILLSLSKVKEHCVEHYYLTMYLKIVIIKTYISNSPSKLKELYLYNIKINDIV